MALAAEVQETNQQRMMFEELGVPLLKPSVIKEDNKACQLLADHAGNFQRTKHIDVRHKFVRECMQRGFIDHCLFTTSDNVADVFTKALPRDQFFKFRQMLVVPRSSIQF